MFEAACPVRFLAIQGVQPERSRYEVQMGGGLDEFECMPVSVRTSCMTTC